ncbi:hypothetical protein UT300007_27150 [Clostridium sp. CTA-7]
MFDDNLYYEIILTNYNNKEEVINLKNILEEHLNCKFKNINECYIEKVIDTSEVENPIIKLLKQRYGRKEKVEFDCNNINSLKELHHNIKDKFSFSQYYGMN